MNNSPPTIPSAPRHRGFTLVELLVVIGVIALLIGMLVPALNRSRESAHRVACLSNLRQVHAAFNLYAMANHDQVPIGYRTASKQFNSMVFSTTAGNRWVLFGLLNTAKLIDNPNVFFCPSENNPKFMYNTSANPWPDSGIMPTANIQAGYADRPQYEIPDTLTTPPGSLVPFTMPRLSGFKDEAIFADLTAARTRIDTRHIDGINVLYANGSARYVRLSAFVQPSDQWPEPALPPVSSYNSTQDAIWAALDKE